MLADGLNLVPGSSIKNGVFGGTGAFPESPTLGQVHYLVAPLDQNEPGLYVYNGTEWVALATGSSVFDVKGSVRAATLENLSLSGLQIIDGVSLRVGDRVLVKDQTIKTQNGIYEVMLGAWVRSKDANTDAKVNASMYCFVEEGVQNADTGWVLTTDAPINVGITELSFAQFSGVGNISAGKGLAKIGNTFALANTPVVPGVYRTVTVDAQGRVTFGSNPTTLAGMGITDAQAIITGAASTITSQNLPVNKLLVSDASGKVAVSSVSVSDLNALQSSAATISGLQSSKQDKLTGAAVTIANQKLSPSKVVVSDTDGNIVSSTVNVSELMRIATLTSGVQEQLDDKLNKSGGQMAGPLTVLNPTAPGHAAHKQYVDDRVAGISKASRSISATVPGDLYQFTGTLRWYPPFKCTLSKLKLALGVASAMTATKVNLRKNGVALFPAGSEPGIAAGANEAVDTALNTVLDVTDYLTIDVVQGAGRDLTLRIDFTDAT